MKILQIQFHGTFIALYKVDPKNFVREKLDEVVLSDRLEIGPEGLLAFQPKYPDLDSSELGAGFLKMRAIFNCLFPPPDTSQSYPRCSVHGYDQASFNLGQPLLEIGTNEEGITGFQPAGLPVYAFAVPKCSTFTPPAEDGCLHGSYKFAIVCHLPGEFCGEAA